MHTVHRAEQAGGRMVPGQVKKSGTKGKKTSLDKEIYDRGTEKIGTYTCNKVT